MREDPFERLKSAISNRLNWGDPSEWKHHQFVLLADLIFEKSGIQLNHNTLKRIWGRVKYEGNASISTRNAMAVFAGYKDWYDYLDKAKITPTPKGRPIKPSQSRRNPGRWLQFFIPGLLVLVFFIVLGRFFRQKGDSILVLKGLSLQVNPTEDVVPHLFEVSYTLPGQMSPGEFELDVQFLKRIRLSSPKAKFKFRYLLPGFGKVRMLYKGNPVDSISVFSRTAGWFCFIPDKEKNENHLRVVIDSSQGTLRADTNDLNRKGLDLNKQFSSNFYHMYHTGLSSSDFELGGKFRNRWKTEPGATQSVHIGVWFEGGELDFHFIRKGYEYLIKHQLGKETLEMQDANPEAFAVDPEVWQNFRLKSREGELRVLRDNDVIFERNLPPNLGKVLGIRLTSKGIGEFSGFHLGPAKD